MSRVPAFARLSARRSVLALSIMLLAGSSAAAAVPTQWTYKLLAKTGNAYNGLPFGATFLASGIPNDPAIDADGNVAIRYTAAGNVDGYFYYNAASDSASLVLPVGTNQLYASSVDLKAGRIAVPEQGLAGGAKVYSLDGTVEKSLTGGAAQVLGSIVGLRVNAAGTAGFRAWASTPAGSTIKLVLDKGFGASRTQTSLASTSDLIYSQIQTPTMNDIEQIGAKVSFSAGSVGLVRFQAGQQPTTVLRLSDLTTHDSLGDQTFMNNAGEFAFTIRRAGTFQWELRKSSSGLGTLIAGAGPNFGNGSWTLSTPRINNRGMVAFRAEGAPISGGFGIPGLYIGDGASLANVVTFNTAVPNAINPGNPALRIGFGNSPNQQTVVGNVAMNDKAQIAFVARLSDGTYGLILASPNPPLTSACSPADIANTDGDAGADGRVDNGDFSLFFSAFFLPGTDPARLVADIANTDGDPSPDSTIDNGDFALFFATFFTGCP
jgi:hypothetical protein